MAFLKTGGCQCGEVRYEITCELTVIYACHCTECQRQSGSAFGMAAVIPAEHFRVTRGTPRDFPRTGESGRTMLCRFCPTCGTRIFHSPAGLAQNCNLKPGTLDDTSWVRPTVHVWTRSAQPWTVVPEGVMVCETQPADRSWLTRRAPS